MYDAINNVSIDMYANIIFISVSGYQLPLYSIHISNIIIYIYNISIGNIYIE